MKIIGLCGGSGSGKGSVSAIFLKLGVPSVDTDAVYHELVSSDSPCLRELVREFGSEILKDGALNRKALAEIVFADEEKRIILNRISHSHVLSFTDTILDGYRAQGFSYAIVDAPLLFESGFDKRCDYTLCVLSDREKRIARIIDRDGISREAAEKRIDSQLSDGELLKRCDFSVYNNSTLAELEIKINDTFKMIKSQE